MEIIDGAFANAAGQSACLMFIVASAPLLRTDPSTSHMSGMSGLL